MDKIQKIVDQWIINNGIRYFDILTNTILLSEEVGEVSSLIARNYGEQSYKNHQIKKEKNLGKELSDVLFVLICIANQTGINLKKSFHQNLKEKKKKRLHQTS